MTPAILGLYGVYFILVAFKGNTSAFLTDMAEQKNYVPWAVAILILGFLDSEAATQKLVRPFIALLITTAIVTHWSKVQTDVKEAYSYLTGTGTSA